MAKKIPVILLEDISEVGRAGDVVFVAEGFARNNLFPEGKAALADSTAGKDAKRAQNRKVAEREQELEKAQAMAEALDGTELMLKAKVKEDTGNEIFGSITAKHIADELSKQMKQAFSAKQIKLEKPIKALGTVPVTLLLLPDVESKIQVTIVPDEET